MFDSFVERYFAYNRRVGKEQYLVPYFMSSHPGCTLQDAVVLAEYIRDIGYNPEQVQDFIPTPGSMATAMYYSGYDPRTMEPVYVPRDPHEKAMQRALMQYRNPKNYDLVHEALVKAGRQDLIGFGPECLIRPTRPKAQQGQQKKTKTQGAKNPSSAKTDAHRKKAAGTGHGNSRKADAHRSEKRKPGSQPKKHH